MCNERSIYSKLLFVRASDKPEWIGCSDPRVFQLSFLVQKPMPLARIDSRFLRYAFHLLRPPISFNGSGIRQFCRLRPKI